MISDSYFEGLEHTLTGLDHLIAMVAVGLISSQLGKRAIWGVPAIFVFMLAIGGIVGLTMPNGAARDGILGSSEIVIIWSDLLLPLAIIWIPVASSRLRYSAMAAVSAGLIAIFGLFHGFAHGGEIPGGAVAWAYVLGFATTSVLMHLLGVGIGEGANFFKQPRVARGIVAAVLLGLAFPGFIDFWGDSIPAWLGRDYLIYVFT